MVPIAEVYESKGKSYSKEDLTADEIEMLQGSRIAVALFPSQVLKIPGTIKCEYEDLTLAGFASAKINRIIVDSIHVNHPEILKISKRNLNGNIQVTDETTLAKVKNDIESLKSSLELFFQIRISFVSLSFVLDHQDSLWLTGLDSISYYPVNRISKNIDDYCDGFFCNAVIDTEEVVLYEVELDCALEAAIATREDRDIARILINYGFQKRTNPGNRKITSCQNCRNARAALFIAQEAKKLGLESSEYPQRNKYFEKASYALRKSARKRFG